MTSITKNQADRCGQNWWKFIPAINRLEVYGSLLIRPRHRRGGALPTANLQYRDFRTGDVRHSLADISKARENIGYNPQFSVKAGLDKAAKWYLENLK